MFKTHVISRTHIYISLNLLTCLAIVHEFATARMKTVILQNSTVLFVFRSLVHKRGAITKPTYNGRRFAHKSFHELSYGHSRWKRVWIYNNIWFKSALCKRHIFLWDNQTNGAFLSAARAELVANIRNALISNADFRQTTALFALREKRLVYVSQLPLLWENRRINRNVGVVWSGHNFTYKNCVLINVCIFANKPVLVKVAIIISRFWFRNILIFNIRKLGVNFRIAY